MTLKFAHTILLALSGGAFCSALAAQPSDSIGWTSISYLKQTEAWLGSENAAGLNVLSLPHISAVEVYAGKENGKFVNYYQSGNSFEFGARAESFYRLNPKVVFYGQMEYSHFSGKSMAGSVFIDPEDAPFDIVEYTDDNRGDKTLENYHLAGAVSARLSERINVGAKVDYTAANYAKQKDLRHVNKLLDMYLTAGMTFRLSPRMEVGANYYYRRRTEGLLLNMYGTTDKVYNSLISYGGFFGKVEQFGENGYTKENEEKPLFDEYHGGTLQLTWNILPGLRLFSEAGYKTRNGYYGKKSPSTVVYSKHDGDRFFYNGSLSWQRHQTLHNLHATFRRETLNNHENIYRYDNEGGGLNNVGYYGTLDTTEKTCWNIDAAYTGHFNVTDGCPAWVLQGGVSYFNRELTASVYPYYRKQDMHRLTSHLCGERNLQKGRNMYSFLLGGAFATGGGTPLQDGLYATETESQSAPASMGLYLHREFEYLTCKQVKGEAGFKYARPIGSKGMKGYTSLRYALTKAFGTGQLDGSSRHQVTWTLGCTF